jgi:hypothetical protein
MAPMKPMFARALPSARAASSAIMNSPSFGC